MDKLLQPRHSYYKTAALNMLLSGYLAGILKAFSCRGIAVITLKGMDFIHNLDVDIGLRPMSDIDILIKHQDLRRAHAVLSDLGYTAPRYADDMLKTSSVVPVNTIMYNLGLPDKPAIHLHWHLINTTWPVYSVVSCFDMSNIWKYARPVAIEGQPAYRLSAEHLLLYLALHNFNHFFVKRMLHEDIAKVIIAYKDDFDWDFFIEETRRLRLEFIVYCSLLQTSRQEDINIIQLKRLMPSQGLSRGQKIVLNRLAEGKNKYFLCCFSYYLKEKGLLKRICFFMRMLFPCRLVMAHSLNCRLNEVKISDYLLRILRRCTQ